MNVDTQLVRRAARRDERAFAAIYRRYHQEIYRFCLALLGNQEDARDALQNTMVKALQALPGEKRSIQLRPWLYQVAHNESIEIVRGRGKTTPIDPELEDPAAGLAETAAERERLRQLLRDLADLPERQRAALVLRELGGLAFVQIGEFFGGSEAVARQAVYEARVSLRSLEAGRAMSCEEVMHRLSNADGRARRRRDLRAHLRDCPDCRAFRDAIESRRRDFAAIAPLPALASAGVLHAILGGAPGATGGAGGATAAAGAGKALSAGLVAKSVATAAVVAAVGVSAADRSGLIHTSLPGGSGNGTPAGQVDSSGDAGASETTPGGKPSSQSSDQGRKSSEAKGASQAHDDKGKQVHRQGGPGTGESASRHGRETAAANGNGASAGHGHANGVSHRRSHHASHGHGRAQAKPKHTPAPPPAPVPSKPKHEGGSTQQPAGETSPQTEQSSGSGAEKAGSGAESKDMP